MSLFTFKDGGLETPTPRTDALHEQLMNDKANYETCYVNARWHAESLERETQNLRSEIRKLEARILKLEPERL